MLKEKKEIKQTKKKKIDKDSVFSPRLKHQVTVC